MRDLSGNVGVEKKSVGEWELTEARGPEGLRFELPGPHMCTLKREQTFINTWLCWFFFLGSSWWLYPLHYQCFDYFFLES